MADREVGMSLHTLIQAAYPDADPLRDYELRDDSDGSGPYLAAWHIAGLVPAGVTMDSATKRWAAHSLDNILDPGAKVIDGLTTAARLAQVAAAEIEATAPGDLVPGTALTREAADELMALAAHVLAFVNTPIAEGGPTPSEVISRFK
jgi:hypothetical protein